MARPAMRRGFTVVELGVLLFAIVLLVGVLLVIMPAISHRPGCGSRHLRDSMQVRGIHQAMVVWSQNNKDLYPLPSLVDIENFTVPEEGAAKDTTANIYSMLIWVGAVGTEMFYSPAEASGSITIHDTYEFDNPKAALTPAKALWDPAFRADFTSKQGGHASYAHMLPTGPRSTLWTNDFNPDTPILGNRGQQVASATYDRSGAVSPIFANLQSNTLLIHGSGTKWEGNIAFNDNHVDFLTTPKTGAYSLPDGSRREDLLFYDEPEDPTGLNAYLGIFTKAGPDPKDFRPIWD